VSDEDEPSWHDQQPVIVAAGVAAVVLLVLLVWAVIHTANKSSRPPEPVEFPSSSAASSTYTTNSTSTTHYTVPSVQTSQENPVVTAPSASTPTDDGRSDVETTTPTTTANPYLTRTPTNAGHI
jgi:cytoskeletal protein RodZ